MNFIIRGTPYVEMAKIWRGSSASASATFTNSVHFGYEIDGRGLSPIVLNRASDAPLYGWHTLTPYGGLQLVSTNRFALYQFKASGYVFDDSDEISRWPNAALWSTGVIDEGDGLAPYGNFVAAFKAENFDPDVWVELFRKSGAKYAALEAGISNVKKRR